MRIRFIIHILYKPESNGTQPVVSVVITSSQQIQAYIVVQLPVPSWLDMDKIPRTEREMTVTDRTNLYALPSAFEDVQLQQLPVP